MLYTFKLFVLKRGDLQIAIGKTVKKRNILAVQYARVFMCGLAPVNKCRSVLFVDHGCFYVINDNSLHVVKVINQNNWR